jgi:tRNA(Met) cytidine acetyltransferase
VPAIDITRWITSLLERLACARQRRLILFEGSRDYCDQRLQELSQLDLPMRLLSNRELQPAAVAFSKADTCLGGEARLVVVDLFDGFNPDVLCIAAGLVQAGGALLLLSPPAVDWDVSTDRYACWQDEKRSARAYFVEYFFDAVARDSGAVSLLTEQSLPDLPEVSPRLQPTPIANGQTAEQAEILRRIESWASSGRNGCALISADRGRGKSTCLGMLVERLQSQLRIVVSANSRQAAAQLLRQCPQASFIAPDQLLRAGPEAELLVIDEAAMIPLPMLRQLSRLYPRQVMATTSGGYEGTGRGFMLRFVNQLETGGLTRYHLEKPVRWSQGDLLEACLDRALMLNAEGVAADGESSAEQCRIEILQQPGSVQALPLLRQAYALLNSAHYRTRPSDLRMMMENPDLLMMIARRRERVVGVTLLNTEGGFDSGLREAVFLGQRRPRGHLLAQMLTAQAGLKGFAGYRGLRVQRIAVAEEFRRQGLGRRMIERAMRYGSENALDYVGASFALDVATSDFWRRLQFQLVHVSYAAGKSSGSHSIAVLKPLGDQLEQEILQLQRRIQQQLPTWMSQFLQTLETRQVTALLRYADYRAETGELEQDDIEAFARGNRGFELCFASLQKYVMQAVARGSFDPEPLLIEKAVQNRDWNLLERESGAEGRKQLQQRLRGFVDALRKAC